MSLAERYQLGDICQDVGKRARLLGALEKAVDGEPYYYHGLFIGLFKLRAFMLLGLMAILFFGALVVIGSYVTNAEIVKGELAFVLGFPACVGALVAMSGGNYLRYFQAYLRFEWFCYRLSKRARRAGMIQSSQVCLDSKKDPKVADIKSASTLKSEVARRQRQSVMHRYARETCSVFHSRGYSLGYFISVVIIYGLLFWSGSAAGLMFSLVLWLALFTFSLEVGGYLFYLSFRLLAGKLLHD